MVTHKLSKPLNNPSLCICIERKHQLHKNSSINSSVLAEFEVYNNTFRNLKKTAKNNNYHSIFECATDMKTKSRTINSIIRLSRVNPKLKLKVNDEIVTDSTETFSTFNDNIFSVEQVMNTNILNLPDDLTANMNRIRNSFVFFF